MSNEWFRFRQFLIRQDQSAMKVGTDGVLLGSWVDCSGCNTILDVGAGTGLISLMMAQRNSLARIIAIEIDEAAAGQAMDNARNCVWHERIEVVQADFRTWVPASGQKFDLLVCNPPFFTQSLRNPDNIRARARHDDELSFAELIEGSARFLEPEGKLALIVPVGRLPEVLALALHYGLFLHRRMDIRGNSGVPVKRVLLEWGKTPGPDEWTELVIETGQRGIYTDQYKMLTAGFYLDLK